MPDTGYSGTPLERKLGLKAGMRACFIGLPDALSCLAAFEGLSDVTKALAPEASEELDYIHAFETDREVLAALAPSLLKAIRPDGMVWISWPKKASKVATTVDDNALRNIMLPLGFVDIKVCAVDAVWSGLKFVIRRDLRR